MNPYIKMFGFRGFFLGEKISGFLRSVPCNIFVRKLPMGMQVKQENICTECQYSWLSVQKCLSLCRLHSDKLNICSSLDVVVIAIQNVAGRRIPAGSIRLCHVCPETQAGGTVLLSLCWKEIPSLGQISLAVWCQQTAAWWHSWGRVCCSPFLSALDVRRENIWDSWKSSGVRWSREELCQAPTGGRVGLGQVGRTDGTDLAWCKEQPK